MMYFHCAIQIPMESSHLHFKFHLLFETAVSQLIHYPEYNSTLILRSEISLQRYILLSDSSLPTSPRPQIQPLHNRHCALKRYIPLKPSSKVCAVSSRYYKEKSEIYPVAMHFAKHSAANALINGWKSVELCQAYILMSIYAVPARRWEEDRSWLYTGRTCGAVSTTQPQTEREMLNRARFGKPSTIKEDYITRYSTDWYKQSRFRDKRFVCERLVPTAFVALPSPQFNTKDGRMMITPFKFIMSSLLLRERHQESHLKHSNKLLYHPNTQSNSSNIKREIGHLCHDDRRPPKTGGKQSSDAVPAASSNSVDPARGSNLRLNKAVNQFVLFTFQIPKVAYKLLKDFIWGFATASLQIEGSANVDGCGKSIWDDFSKQPGKTVDGRDGDVATDSYRLWKEDIALLAQYGVKSYCFSLSWSCIIPLGGRNDPVNPKGIAFYSNFINALLYHWHIPQAQHDRYGDWLNKDEIVQDYVRYAKVCFQAFGNQVKHWLTVNEPWCISIFGYGRGVFAPGRSSDRGRSPKATPPPNRGFKLYREEFKAVQGGQIGITLNGDWAMPYNDSPQNVEAVQHTLDVAIGWFAVLRERLLEFTPEELKVVKESSDFYGMNTYTINLCSTFILFT
ncbi:glycoside hydrolase superfamily [Suillus placidus]|uniref:Glycoside hydrolase superfamily n=1 Tax=Suillus placidus TaxID=48579 RepID=A0A9P6ZHR4_9AGAM|nr:glycoside hydrolase superfamily [Suillus placidus]